MKINGLEVKVAVPTYNGGRNFKNFITALQKQDELQPEDVLVVDSSSLDATAILAETAGFKVEVIPHNEFSHGGTRAKIVEELQGDIIVFLTQDAILKDKDSIKKLVSVFVDDKIAAVYGRQLPFEDTNTFGTFARKFNYGEESFINTMEDKKTKGIKVAFLSDSFSAYRKEALLSIGNFNKDLNFGEDTIAAGKLLLKGYNTAYCAKACIYHAHSYSIAEEFNRYKITGAFHKKEQWLLDTFGKAEGEGLKFVKEEIKYLVKEGKWYLVPWSFVRNVTKFVGYKIGSWM